MDSVAFVLVGALVLGVVGFFLKQMASGLLAARRKKEVAPEPKKVEEKSLEVDSKPLKLTFVQMPSLTRAYSEAIVRGVPGATKYREKPSRDDFMRLEKDSHLTFRILPDSELSIANWFIARRIHTLDSMSLSSFNTETFTCLKKLKEDASGLLESDWEGNCPFCSLYMRMSKRKALETSNAELAIIRQLRPMPRFYYNIVVRHSDGYGDPKILSMGKMTHEQFISRVQAGEYFYSIENGRDVHMSREEVRAGDAQYPKYNIRLSPFSGPLGSVEQMVYFLRNQWKLENVIPHPSTSMTVEEVNKFFIGFASRQKICDYEDILS